MALLGGDTLSFSTVVEHYDYNVGLNGENDLHFKFRIWGADNGEDISVFDALWDEVIFFIERAYTLVEGLHWRAGQDPLVLDLDGDGIETVRLSQSAANFDFDNDFFAERTGWVGSDDGVLAVDVNHDGVIDDITKPLMKDVINPLYAAYDILDEARQRRGALDLDLPERQILIDDKGKMTGVQKRATIAHRFTILGQ